MLVAAMVWGPAPAAASRAPDPNGVIHTCYGPSDGYELHVRGTRRSCLAGQASLSWNQRGRRGTFGPLPRLALSLNLELQLAVVEKPASQRKSLWTCLEEVTTHLKTVIEFVGLSLLVVSLVLIPLRSLAGRPWCLWFSLRLWRFRLFRKLGPELQIQPFDDSALDKRLGGGFTLDVRARVASEPENGGRLYLITPEDPPAGALADLKAVPQAQALAVALSLLSRATLRARLVVNGLLTPASGDSVSVSLALWRNSKFVTGAELWPWARRDAACGGCVSNRAQAAAAAGWIQHAVADQTPGPPGSEVFPSRDPRSWALFCAGAELSRFSCQDEAQECHERALEVDPENIGALVDLAHLLRLRAEGENGVADFARAQELAQRAIALIERRNAASGWWARRENREDPNWYRAQIVLAAINSVWGRHRRGRSKAEKAAAEARRTSAYCGAVKIARAAMGERCLLEVAFGREQLENAAAGKQPTCRTRCALKLRAWKKGKRFQWKRDGRRAVELHTLLATTFEPGALLLVAINLPNSGELSCKDAARTADVLAVREALKDPAARRSSDDTRGTLIEYVRAVSHRSPRVTYNLACCYSVAATAPGNDHRENHLELAAGYLRKSVEATSRFERRALLGHAGRDRDLVALRSADPALIGDLRKLIPR